MKFKSVKGVRLGDSFFEFTVECQLPQTPTTSVAFDEIVRLWTDIYAREMTQKINILRDKLKTPS